MSKTVRTLYLMSGIPASGKSTYARKLAASNGAVYISRDEIRFAVLKDNEDYFSHEDEVYDLFIMNIQEALDGGNNCIADATHLSMSARTKILNRLNLAGVKIVLIIMDTPLAVCLERNAKRAGRARVPDSAIKKMWLNFKSPNAEEAKRYIQIKKVKEAEYNE